MDKILVVIPVINLWDEYTIHAMESIAANVCSVPFDVLIVDQNSKDATLEKAEDFGNRKMPGRVHLLHQVQNIGCAAGWNSGVQWGVKNGFTHFVVSNNDVLFGPSVIENMYQRMKRGDVLLTSAVDVIKEIPVPQMVLNPENAVNKKEDTEAPHPNFSCFMIDLNTLDKVGMFDEEFYPAYFEDNSYHYRLKLVGGEKAGIANTKAVFVHYGSRTQNQNPGTPIVPGPAFVKNRNMFVKMWGGEPMHETYTHPYNDQSLSPCKKNNAMEFDKINS